MKSLINWHWNEKNCKQNNGKKYALRKINVICIQIVDRHMHSHFRTVPYSGKGIKFISLPITKTDRERIKKNRNWKTKNAFILNLIFWQKSACNSFSIHSCLANICESKRNCGFLREKIIQNTNLCWISFLRIINVAHNDGHQYTIHICMESWMRTEDGDEMETLEKTKKKQYHYYPSSNRFELVCTWKSIRCVKVWWLCRTQRICMAYIMSIKQKAKKRFTKFCVDSFNRNVFQVFYWGIIIVWTAFLFYLLRLKVELIFRTDTFAETQRFHTFQL